MQTNHILGIDISKLTFDVCCHNTAQGTQFPNNKKGFLAFEKWLQTQLPAQCLSGEAPKPLTVMEHTGHYSFSLERWLQQKGLPFHKHSGLDIRRSMGIVRGKTDAADARTIARFAYQRREELQPTTPKSETEVKLAQLCSTREKLVEDRKAHHVRLAEMKASMGKELCKEVSSMEAAVIKCLDKQIQTADKAIATLIKEDEALHQNNELIRSVKGIGPVTATALLLYTRNFTTFSDWRHFASWAGVAPFEYRSGTSINGRTKLSPLANKKMKSLLHSAACIAIIHDTELREYYHRKVAEGKPKMKVFNAVRCKLLARVFAVIKRKSPFQPLNPRLSEKQNLPVS